MMKTCLLIIVAAFLMLACKKSTSVSPSLFGKWELRKRYGGFIIPHDSVYKPGKGNILQFNSDSTYKRYTNGTLSQQGIYHIRRNGYRVDQNTYDELILGSDTSFHSLISINGDLLTIKPFLPDISSFDYEKIRN